MMKILPLIFACLVCAAAPQVIQAQFSGGMSLEQIHQLFRDGHASIAMRELKYNRDETIECLEELFQIAQSADQAEQLQALELIGDLRRFGTPSVEPIHGLLSDEDRKVRVAAAEAILKVEGAEGPKALPAIKEFCQAIRSGENEERLDALELMAYLDYPRDTALSVLLDAAVDADPEIRALCMALLDGSIDIERERQVLRRGLKDNSPVNRAVAAKSLWRLDEPADNIMPTLVRLIEDFNAAPNDGDTGERDDGSKIEDGIVDISNVDISLNREAKDENSKKLDTACIQYVCRLICEIGPEAKSALPSLMEATEARDVYSRIEAIKAIGALGMEGTAALACLEVALLDTESHSAPFVHQSWHASDYAAVAMRRIGAPRDRFLKFAHDLDNRVQVLSMMQLLQYPIDLKTVHCFEEELGNADPGTRAFAARALGLADEPARESIPALIELIDDEEEYQDWQTFYVTEPVWKAALTSLRSLDPDGKRIDPTVVIRRKLETGPLTPGLAELIIHRGSQGSDLAPLLRDFLEDRSQRVLAACVLAAIAPETPGLVDILIEALEEAHEGDQLDLENTRFTINALGDLQERAKKAVDVLQRVGDGDGHFAFRGEIELALVKIEPESRRSNLRLTKALQFSTGRFNRFEKQKLHPVWMERTSSTNAWKDVLLHGLRDEFWIRENEFQHRTKNLGELKMGSAELMLDAGFHPPELLAILIELCNHEDQNVRCRAASAIGRLGKQAEPAISALLPLLRERPHIIEDDDLSSANVSMDPSQAAFDALVKIGSSSIPVLSATMNDQRAFVRQRSIQALAAIGNPTQEVQTAWFLAVEDRSDQVRCAAASAIATILESIDRVIEAELRLSKDHRASVRAAAARALGEIETNNQSVRQTLDKLQNDPLALVRAAAVEALKRIEPR